MRTLIGLAFAATTASSFAITAFWAQPWNAATRLPSWTSAIASTINPIPARRQCFDDFRVSRNLSAAMITFWGTPSSPIQLGRPFRISIHRENGATCRPIQTPIWTYYGIVPGVMQIPDLQGRMVFRFNHTIAANNPLNLTAGKYWICVAEVDNVSYRPNGVSDFGWSAFQPMRFCPAIAYNWNNTVNQPLIDPINQQRDDLAFNLYY